MATSSGFYTEADHTTHGFIWYHQNVIKTIDFPGMPTGTVPFDINKAGTVVGGVWGINAGGTFPNNGWVWKNGTFSNMNPFNNGAAAPCCWSVNGIANNGFIVGEVFQADFHNAWFKSATDQDFFMDIPSGNNGADTFGMGVNSGADVVGYSFQGWFAPHMAAALMVAWSIGRVQGQQAQANQVVFASPDQAKFTEVRKGSSMAPIWGDANLEAHGTFTKFVPGLTPAPTPTPTMSGLS